MFLEFLFTCPVTTLLTTTMIIIWYHLVSKSIDPSKVAITSNTYLGIRQYWRGVSAVFSHYYIFHIIMNLLSFIGSYKLEIIFGNIAYFKMITIIVVFAPLIDSLIRKVLQLNTDLYCVGFSYVICGISPLIYQFIPECSTFGYKYSCFYQPFIEILISQLLCPMASFIAHISGLIVGLAIYFGLFDWFTDELFCLVFPCLVIFYSHSYSTTRLLVPKKVYVSPWKNGIVPLFWGKI